MAQSLDDRLYRLVTFQDYNTWMPLLAVSLLGVSAGVIGVFLVLRGRALVGDVVGHAALPGVVIAFFVQELLSTGAGRNVGGLLMGALLSGLAGAGCVLLIDRYSRIKADAALAIVLSLFYGGGTALLTMVQRLSSGGQAGLKSYLSGKSASLVASDVWLSGLMAVLLLGVTLLLFKNWVLLCFDEAYAAAQGQPVGWLDALLITLAAMISVLGMQSVGLVLVVGLLIIPPAAARFWTDDVRWMAIGSGIIGGLSGALGVAISSLGPRIATGPTIILCSSAIFLLSVFAGARRGVWWQWRMQRQLQQEIQRQDLQRACYEAIEAECGRIPTFDELTTRTVALATLQHELAIEPARLRRLIEVAMAESWLVPAGDAAWRLTRTGAELAARTTRNHRLWEQYLLAYADVAPGQVHRYADTIEHVLDAALVAELEQLLAGQARGLPQIGAKSQATRP